METTIVSFDKQHKKIITDIRHAVFSIEQQIDADLDLDGKDDDAQHVLVQINGDNVGTARMQNDGHIGRLAVLKHHRNKGLGSALMNGLIDVAQNNQLKRVFLGAQIQTIGFYQKLGFTCYGNPFDEVGIEHIHMEKTVVKWPAVLQYQGDDELVYLHDFSDFYADAKNLFQSFHNGDKLIDSKGATYNLSKTADKQISINPKNNTTTVALFETLVKKHMSVMDQCCISKIQLSNYKEGFNLLKAVLN